LLHGPVGGVQAVHPYGPKAEGMIITDTALHQQCGTIRAQSA
jgi:hypothetical protein